MKRMLLLAVTIGLVIAGIKILPHIDGWDFSLKQFFVQTDSPQSSTPSSEDQISQEAPISHSETRVKDNAEDQNDSTQQKQPAENWSGDLYVIKRFSVVHSDGIQGFAIGKRVKLVREDVGDYIVTDGLVEGKAPKSYFSGNPPDTAQSSTPTVPTARNTAAQPESIASLAPQPRDAGVDYNRLFLEDFKRMDLLVSRATSVEVDITPHSSDVKVFLSIDEVREQFQQWDVKGEGIRLIESQVATITKLIVMKQLQFNKKHNLSNTGDITGSLGVIGSGVTGRPKRVIVGKSFYDTTSDDIGFQPQDGINRVILSGDDGSITVH